MYRLRSTDSHRLGANEKKITGFKHELTSGHQELIYWSDLALSFLFPVLLPPPCAPYEKFKFIRFVVFPAKPSVGIGGDTIIFNLAGCTRQL